MAKVRDPKQLVRDEVRRNVRLMEADARLSCSEAICRTILDSEIWARAQLLLAFVSLPDEVETTSLLTAALEQGKRLGLPRFGEEGLVFYEVRDLDALRVDNSLAIYQPSRDLPVIISSEAPRSVGELLVITPGRAFTRGGDRLGRGGGFYDRFFAAIRRAQLPVTAVGVAFALQLYEELPVGPTDERVDGVVTERDTIGW